MKLLLISNSTNAGERYLDHPKGQIKEFLGNTPVNALFIPFAAVTFSYEEYEGKVQDRFKEVGHSVTSIHRRDDPEKAIEEASAIVVGGGNTFHLMYELQKRGLVELIRRKVMDNTPYIGWSAGANIACPTICTTNDMPIIEPESFEALKLVPFQINPHYLDANPKGHAGETREKRINEFLVANPDIEVIGLREGTMLWYDNKSLSLLGPVNARLFKRDSSPREISGDEDLASLLL